MKHIFITKLKSGIDAWYKAFPTLTLWTGLGAADTIAKQQDTVCWIHAQLEFPDEWLQQLQALTSQYPQLKVVVLSNNPEQAESFRALAGGAVGYLHAYSHQNILKEVSSVVIHGGVWLGRDLLKYLIGFTAQQASPVNTGADEALEKLTKREREVALEAAKGFSNKEIARTLAISERTVKAHLTSVFETLQVRDRLHLALILQGGTPEGQMHNHFFSTRGMNKLHLHS